MKKKCALLSMCLSGLMLASCQSGLYRNVTSVYPLEAGEQILDEKTWNEAFDFDDNKNMTVKMRMTLDYSVVKDFSSVASSFEMNYSVARMDNYFLISLEANLTYSDGDKFTSEKEQIFIDTNNKEPGYLNIYDAYYYDESFLYLQQMEFEKPLETEPLIEFDLSIYDMDNFDYEESSKSYKAKDLSKFENASVSGSNSELTSNDIEMEINRLNVSFENGKLRNVNYIGLATRDVENKSYTFPFACEYTIGDIGTTRIENPVE